MRCLLWGFWRKLPRYNGTALYFFTILSDMRHDTNKIRPCLIDYNHETTDLTENLELNLCGKTQGRDIRHAECRQYVTAKKKCMEIFLCPDDLLSHPSILGVTMFLYRFVRRRRPQILVHAITFEQLFGFLSFLAQLLALTCRLPD